MSARGYALMSMCVRPGLGSPGGSVQRPDVGGGRVLLPAEPSLCTLPLLSRWSLGVAQAGLELRGSRDSLISAS